MDFSQLALLVVVAASFGFVAKLLKQPLLVGYLFAGLFLSLTGLISDQALLENLGKIGVALLLFLLGLEMNLREVATIGKHASVSGFFEMALTGVVGFGLSLLLGFSPISSAYIAIALTFSSTIIMVKLLSEKKDLSSLYGKIAVGSLLFQDLVAILILIFLAGVGQGGATAFDYLFIFVKLTLLVGVLWVVSRKLVPVFFERFVSGSNELLYIVSIAWALGVASFVSGPVGFSLEIGGFLAGLALSTLPEHLQIASRSRSLRDFFLTIFFVYLGTQLAIEGSISGLIFPALVFSFVVLVVNPISVLLVMGFMGYKKRTSFLSSLTMSQTSEFSLILMTVGASLGHISQSDVATVVLVTAVTMTVSTYIILGGGKLYKKLEKYLSIFERKHTKAEVFVDESKMFDHIILVGADRTGTSLSRFFRKRNKDFVVVDFNPAVYSRMAAQNYNIIFGDITDADIIEAANLKGAKLVVSTISQLEDNLILLEYIKKLEKPPRTIMTMSTKRDAIKLYEKGASYVIVPDIVAGEYIRHLIETHGIGEITLEKLGKSHFRRLMQL